jgi:mono/diheme cytochrome c family protein
MIAFSANIKSMFSKRVVLVVGMLMLASIVTSACAVQESNTYPVETFSEMHYAQSHKLQEPPRLAPVADSVVFETAGGADSVLNVPDKQERAYDAAVAGDLYRVNCAVCHGDDGRGDGKAVRHITSNNSFWATTNGAPYKAPPDLVDSAANRLTDPDVMYSFVAGWSGPVMPQFGSLLAEEDIRDIVNYIFDDTTGLSK